MIDEKYGKYRYFYTLTQKITADRPPKNGPGKNFIP